jgi:hypothetical protein
MSHLVAPLSLLNGQPRTLAECFCYVKTAHDYLVAQGAVAIAQAVECRESVTWGTAIKRLRVEFPKEGQPEGVQPRDESHNLVEVINQCATIERLIDALTWIQNEASGLNDYRVWRCHPTTSSLQSEEEDIGDNDLILIGPDGAYARFEVSDIVSSKDGNRKEENDLMSLGLWQKDRSAISDIAWPMGRFFLVVSQDFAPRLRKPSKSRYRAHLRYSETTVGRTSIFEITPRVP